MISDLFQIWISFLSCWRRLSCLSYLTIWTQTHFGLDFSQLTVLVTPGTETAALWVLNDLLTASDDGQVSLLTLLDLCAAFDTTDHILLHRLEHAFSTQKSALLFFRSYLTERQQTVSMSGYSSNPSTLRYGVPQGSILGPVLFLLYTPPLSQITDRHSVSP